MTKTNFVQLIFIFLILGGGNYAFAQYAMGFKGGGSISSYKISGGNYAKFNGIISSAWTPTFDFFFRMNKDWIVLPGVEVGYSGRYAPVNMNAKRDGSPAFSTKADYTAHYFNIYLYPELGLGKKLRGKFNVGPYLAINVYTDRTGVSRVYDGQQTSTSFIGSGKGEWKILDMGLRADLGVELLVYQSLGVTLNVTGRMNLLNLVDHVPQFTDIKITGYDLQVRGGIFVHLKDLIYRKKN